jgi:prevent-host-death family protein
VALQTSWLTPQGYVHRPYLAGEIDLIAVHCRELDRSYLLSSGPLAGRRAIYLRLSPPLNGQRASINLAEEYEFAGAVAQLEERRAGSAKAEGSSPSSSTPGGPALVGAHQFRNHFGYYMERAAAGEQVLGTRRGKPTVRLSPAEEQLPMAA